MRFDTQHLQSQKGKVAVALGVVYVIWGSTYLAIRVGVETIPPLLMSGVRFIVAGGFLYAVMIRSTPRDERPTRRQWRSAAIIGTLLLLGGNGGVVLAEQRGVPSSISALVVGTVPLWMALIGRLFYGERLPAKAAIGVIVGFAGVALLARPTSGAGFTLSSTLLIMAGTCAWAAGSLYSRRAPLPKRALLATAMEMLAGGVAMFIAALAGGEFGRLHPTAISGRSILALVYLLVFGSLVAFSAYIWLLGNARTSLVATYAYVNPVVAVLLGRLILDERITALKVVAGAIIVGAVALIVGAGHSASPADAPPPPEEP